jgi:hypothetical protein
VLAEPADRPLIAVPSAQAAAALRALLARPGVTRARFWVAEEEGEQAPNPEAALRPGGDARSGRFLLAEGTGEAAVLAAAAEAAVALGIATAGPPAIHRLLVARDAAPVA